MTATGRAACHLRNSAAASCRAGAETRAASLNVSTALARVGGGCPTVRETRRRGFAGFAASNSASGRAASDHKRPATTTSAWSWVDSRFVTVIEENSLTGSSKIIVLAATERPHESGEACDAKSQRHGDEVEKIRHVALWVASDRCDAAAAVVPAPRSERLSSKRSAFAITASDDKDIAMAATSGVTKPRIAIGTATTL